MSEHFVARLVRRADAAINAEDFDTVVGISADDTAGWFCTIGDSYGHGSIE